MCTASEDLEKKKKNNNNNQCHLHSPSDLYFTLVAGVKHLYDLLYQHGTLQCLPPNTLCLRHVPQHQIVSIAEHLLHTAGSTNENAMKEPYWSPKRKNLRIAWKQCNTKDTVEMVQQRKRGRTITN